MSVFTAVYSAQIKVAGVWTTITSSILDISGSNEATLNPDNALAFGDSSQIRITVRGKLALQSYDWELASFKATFGINGNSQLAFHGVITGRERSLDDLTFTCEGFAALLRDTKAYSPAFHRRPIATKTTASSVEDPDDAAYQAGPINWLLWQAGGRPVEQDANPTYVSEASFWYTCDHALLAPDWTWIAGENGWEEALKLVQASGGQLYQAPDGVIAYRQPYMIADGSGSITLTPSDYRTVRERQSSRQSMDTAIVTFLPRVLRPMQDVATDDTPRLIPAGETIAFDIEPQWPIASLETKTDTTLKDDALIVVFVSGVGAATPDTHYSHTISYSAQKISISITNDTTAPLAVHKVTLRGMPIIAGEAGNVTQGSGTRMKTVCDGNTYIQNQAHAERLANIYMDFYGDAHPLRTVSGCVYDPDATIGDVVALTVTEWSLSAVDHVITAIRHNQTGAEMELDLVEVDGLPKTSDHFIVGNDHTGLTKRLGY